jgi:hypothetical protein
MRRTPVITATLACSLAFAGPAAARPFGEKGQYIVTTDAHLDFEKNRAVLEGTEDTVDTEYAFVLAGDYTRFHRVTFGVDLGFRGNVAEQGNAKVSDKAFLIGARAGYVVPLAEGIALWPRLGIGYANTTYDTPTSELTVASTRVTAQLPFVFNPYPQIIVGLTPSFAKEFRATTGDETPVPKRTDYGVHLLIGFWFE